VRRGRFVHREEEHENHERWLVSYADMVTLLMAFFMMLYGMSILDLRKFEDFKAGVAKQLGKAPVVEGGQGILVAGTGLMEAAGPTTGAGNRTGATDAVEVRGEATREDIGSLVSEVNRRLHEQGLDGAVSLEADPRGLVIYMSDRVLFESGDSGISMQGQQVLLSIAQVLGHIDNTFVVEGHTDNVPTRGTRWPSNWELSTSRATNVLRYLVELAGLAAPRASAAGYADTRPRVPNDSDAHRGINRRVEIVIIIPPEERSSDAEEV
jgi:chemotaxis protein MotB